MQVRNFDARFERNLIGAPKHVLRGRAALVSNCPDAVGVKFRLTAFDNTRRIIGSVERWTGGDRSTVAPGELKVSLDGWLSYDQRIVGFDLRPVELRYWR